MPRRDDVSVIVQGVNLEFLTYVDYNGPLSIAESVGVSDSMEVGVALGRQFDDAATVSDAFDTSIGFERTVDDGVVASDAFDSIVAYTLDVGDGVTMGDSPSINVGAEMNSTINESVTVSDAVLMAPIKPLVLADSVGTSDAFASDDPSWRRVAMLLKGNAPVGKQNSIFIDSTAIPVTLTPTGAVQQGAKSPFQGAGGSVLIKNPGDMITAPVSVNYAFGLGDFTVECWFWINGNSPLDGSGSARGGTLIATYPVGAGGGWDLSVQGDADYTGTPYVFFESGVNVVGAGVGKITQNEWHHVAAVGIGGNVKIYLDGVVGGAAVAFASIGAPGPLTIGRSQLGSGYNRDFNGYVSEVAISKGTAKYLGNFTPPTAPYAPAGWTFLCHFDNAGMIDNARQSNLYAGGNVQGSGGTIYYDGVSAFLQAEPSMNWDFGYGDFTIEAWIYLDGNSPPDGGGQRYGNIVGTYGPLDAGNKWYWSVLGDTTTTGHGLLLEVIYNNQYTNTVSPIPISKQAWHHVAISNNGGFWRQYLDGVMITPADDRRGYPVSGLGPLRVGALNLGGYERYFNGHMIDLRITNGEGRYPGNFVPPPMSSLPIGAPTGKPNPVRNFHPYELTYPSDAPAIANVPVANTTWDLATAGPHMVLSGGNRDVTCDIGAYFANVRSTTTRNTGKLYFEITNMLAQSQTGGAPGFALCLPGFNNATYLENKGGMVILTYGEARDWNNATYSLAFPVWNGAGDILCVSLDLTTLRQMWVSRPGGICNGNPAANPATGVGGVYIGDTSTMAGAPGSQAAIYAMPYTSNCKFHLNTGKDAFAGVVPAGFGPWA